MVRLSLCLLLTAGARAGVAIRPSLAPGLPAASIPLFAPAPQAPSAATPLALTPTLHIALPLPSIPSAAIAPTAAKAAGAALPRDSARSVLEALTDALSSAGKASPGASARIAAGAFDGTVSPGALELALPGISARPARRANAVTPAEDEERFPGELMGSQGVVSTPGSIFGWKPWSEAKGHGLFPVDALVRWFFGRPASGLGAGFEFRGAARREEARVFFYGEKHSDKALIAANMRALASDIDPRRGGIVLVEGYLGRTLRGSEAERFLAHRGLEVSQLESRKVDISRLEVRGWDDPASHDASTSLSLQHHMELLNLNLLVCGEGRGLKYYAALARQARRVADAYFAMRTAVIEARNADLDRAVAEAASEADGATVHVVAGSEHLLEHPLLARIPLLGRSGFRKSLAAAIGQRPWWAAKPPDSRN